MGKAVVYPISFPFELEGKLVALGPRGEGGGGCNTGGKMIIVRFWYLFHLYRLFFKKVKKRASEFSDRLLVRTLHFCRGHGFNPWSGN